MLLYRWLLDIAEKKGGAKALICRDNYISWRSLVDRVDRRASEFSSIGIRPGDLVALMLGNVPDLIILSLALSKLNAAPVPIDPTTNSRELEVLRDVIPLRGLITRPRGGEISTSLGGTGKKSASSRSKKPSPETRKRLQGTLLSCSIYPTEERPLPKGDGIVAALLFTTSGNGQLKPVERTHGNLKAEAQQVGEALGFNDEDRALLTVPLYHSFAFDVGFAASLRAGAALFLEDEVTPNKIIKIVKEQKITILPGNFALFEGMGQLPAVKPLSHKPIRFISVGGGLSGSPLEHFYSKYGTRPLSCFHTTETCTISIDVKGQSGETVGKPLQGVELKITHPTTNKPLGSSKTGVLWVNSKATSPLKLAPPVKPVDGVIPVGGRDKENWYRTGDLASLDRSGRLTLQGREDDLVRIDGRRVALGEVANCLQTFPNIEAATALVIQDPMAGPILIARVVLKEKIKISSDEVVDHCTKYLSPYKVPRRIEFCDKL